MKILKGFGGHPPGSSAVLEKYEKLTPRNPKKFSEVFHVKFSAFSIKWTKWI